MKQYILLLLAILYNCDTRSSAILRQPLKKLPNLGSKAVTKPATRHIMNETFPRIANDYWEYLKTGTGKSAYINLITTDTEKDGYKPLGLTQKNIQFIKNGILEYFMGGKPTTITTMPTSAAMQTPAASQVKEIKYTFDRNLVFAHAKLPRFIEQYYQNITLQTLGEIVNHEDYNFLGPKECRVSVANFFLQEWNRKHNQPQRYWYIPKNTTPSSDFLEDIVHNVRLAIFHTRRTCKNIIYIINDQNDINNDMNIDKNIEYIVVPASKIQDQNVNNTLDKLLHETAGDLNLKIIIAFNDTIEHISDNFNINKYINHAIITGYNITSIGDRSIILCPKLKTLVLPDSLTSVGDDFLYGCSELTAISLPNSLTSVKNHFLSGCTGLTTLVPPNNLIKVGNYFLSGCTGLTSLILPNNLTKVGDYFLSGCTGLTSFTLPNNLAQTGNSFLSGCTELTTLILPSNLTKVGESFLRGCTRLTSLILPNNLTKVENYFLDECSGLTILTLPDSLTSVGNYFLYRCTGLISLAIPDSLTSVENYFLSECTGLMTLILSNNLTKVEDRFLSGCTGLQKIIMSQKTLNTIKEKNNSFERRFKDKIEIRD
ncbi:leucine-rich repeat protein [Candidatus Dependentiae bacterium]|nr:leucine-rich repeat protein [Candidatus Dependentiae bacterium]